MRDFILFYINGKRKMVRGEKAFLSLADYLRYEERLTGTKVVCAEGDCGACTVLQSCPEAGHAGTGMRIINSCITFVYLLDTSHIITVEGMKNGEELHPIQQSMVDHHASQCGFCTPGFVMGLAGLFENKDKFTEKHVKNHLTGNLCRCTGYKSIIESALELEKKRQTDPQMRKRLSLQERYQTDLIAKDLLAHQGQGVRIESGGKVFAAPSTLKEALSFKADHPDARIFSSATDLGVQINKGRSVSSHKLGLNLVPELHRLAMEKTPTGDLLSVGARVTLADLQNYTEKLIPEFSRFLNIFASPQIKNVGTLVGNLANASPIADTVPFLFIMEATVELHGQKGIRTVPVVDFIKGYKSLDMGQDEIIARVQIPMHRNDERIRLYKVSKRKDLDISGINAAFLLNLDSPNGNKVKELRISFGGVGPTVLRLRKLEAHFQGKEFNRENMEKAISLLPQEISPISDVRGSAGYRLMLAKNILLKFFLDMTQDRHHQHQNQLSREA